MSDPIFDLLHQCTVRLELPQSLGTGFFVAPGRILTCAHVVEACRDRPEQIRIRHAEHDRVVLAVEALPTPYPDLALLHIDLDDHPCVYLDTHVDSGQQLYAYGYTRHSPGGEAVTVEYEGPARLDDKRWLLKFKAGQVIPGYSGSPLLNRRTLTVCGIMKSTRDRLTALGGGGVPVDVILAEFPSLTRLQQMFHNWDGRWAEASRQQRAQETDSGLPKVTIVAEVTQVQRQTETVEIDVAHLAPQTKLTNLWCPQSLDWYADELVALGSRDSTVQVARLDGQIVKQFPVTAYPSFVAVHDRRLLAAVCYTRLYLADLRADEMRSIEVDANASGYGVAWAADGEYIAVGGTNTLKVFRSDLTLVAEHHLGGKHGATAVTWHPANATLYVGLGNGELWRLTAPFDHPRVLCKGVSSPIALRSAEADDRLACLWQDGTLEIRRDADVLNTVVVRGHDSWASNGPKLAWCLDQTVLACATGLSNELVLWQIGTGCVLTCRLPRRVLSVDASPSGADLLVGLDEDSRQDGLVSLVPGTNLAAAFSVAAPTGMRSVAEAHLLNADWTRLLELVEDRRDGRDPAYDLHLAIPLADEKFAWWEESVRKADAEPDIVRNLMQRLSKARKRAGDVMDDLLWAAENMRETGYYETQIRATCDRILSFEVNEILGRLGIHGYPPIEQLEEFVAFTLGAERDNLVELGFDTDNGGIIAVIPLDFLLEVEQLGKIGEALGEKYGATTRRQKIVLACQMARDFDLAFGSYEQRDLWTRYVLPQCVVRYPRDDVIFRPSEVRSFGLA